MQAPDYVGNEKLIGWVKEIAELTKPDAIHWCDGSQREYDAMCEKLIEAGTFTRLNEAKRPNSFLARPTPEFGAAVDTRFISGIGTQDDRMLILLDIETLLDSADMGQASVVEDAAA